MTAEIENRLRDAAAAIGATHTDPGLLALRAQREGLLDVAYAIESSSVGELLLAVTPRGLVRIAYLDRQRTDDVLTDLAARVSPRVIEAARPLDDVRRQLELYLGGRVASFDLTLDWSLVGPFGRDVLGRTAEIPYGEVATYGEVARSIGHPRAARAAGNALGRNPIPIVVPCHRVVPGSGKLGGYGGGQERKRFLLSLERGTEARGSGFGI
jgi:methylated-DNA-[protein]-cysteine S-methyltransferase